MPSIDPNDQLTHDDRLRLLNVNLARPVRYVDKRNMYARNVHDLEMPAHDLQEMSDIELVDLCDGSVGNHFGGKVERTSTTTATVTVWID